MTSQGSAKPDPVRQPQTVVEEPLEDDEPTKAEILDGIRKGFRQALAGDTRPLDDLLDEVRQELDENAHSGSS